MKPKLRLRVASHNVTWLLGTRFPKSIPLVFVVGYPKSGSTWAAQLVAHVLELPFPRFSLLPIGCPAVVMGHKRVWKSYPRGVYVVRDGRDAIASQFFYQLSQIPEGDHPRLTGLQRRSFPNLVNKADLDGVFADFVARQLINPIAAHANWGNHVRSYFDVANPNISLVKYEDLHNDGEAALGRVVTDLTGEPADPDRIREALARFKFGKQSTRRGNLASPAYLRKGKAGDWVNHFTPRAAELFDRACGDMLIKMGYEPDHAWVESVKATPPILAAT